MGVSERGFLALRRRDELREQLTSALVGGIAVPGTTIELVNAWREEKRVAEYFTIDAEKAVTVPEPDEAKLKQTYDANKGDSSCRVPQACGARPVDRRHQEKSWK